MQLARKRANDREAQRAIRARTREHIDRLEARVREYENKELQDEKVQRVMKRNQELERQVASLLSQPCPHCSAPGMFFSIFFLLLSSPSRARKSRLPRAC